MSESLSLEEILRRIPHRYPFLFVDRVLEMEPGQRGRGVKMVSATDPYLQGHFPGHPIFPGVLIIEALGQMGALLFSEPSENGAPDSEGKYLARVEKARFRRPVRPGEMLELDVNVLKVFGNLVILQGRALVGEELVASAELTFTIG